MNNQKLIRTLKYRFRSVFVDCPDSNEEFFDNLKHCISIFDPEWVQNLKPSSEKSIKKLENMVERDFGKELPPSYKLYLQEMGADDGNLLLQYVADLCYFDDWNLENRYFDKGDMAESPQKCMAKLSDEELAGKRMLSFLWYLFTERLSISKGFAFTLNEENPDEIIFSHTALGPDCYDTFPKQLAYCEYLKALHWIENHSEKMKRKKWDNLSCSDSESIFSVCFRSHCPIEWMDENGKTQYSFYAEFLENIESRFYLEEAWFSRQKVFPDRVVYCSDDDHAFFSRYIAFSLVSDLTLLIEWHSAHFDIYYRPNDRPFIQVHILGKDISEIKEIINAVLEDTVLFEAEKDKSRIFAKMELE